MRDSEQLELDSRLGGAWRDDHRYLLNLGFRVLGSISEAEDVVQEAFARLVDQDLDEIDDVRGWLAVVVTRLCLDQLRSADRRRRAPAGPHKREHAPAHGMDPADRITLDDEVRLALHIVMDRLTPAERIAFVLHDVFAYPFDAISEILGRSPAACRQLASRARRTVDPYEPNRVGSETDDADRVAEKFIAACSTGDLDGMIALMHPDCSSHVDTGAEIGDLVELPRLGTVGQGPTVVGRDAVARLALRHNGPGTSTTLLSVPSLRTPTAIGLHEGRVVVHFTMTVVDRLITRGDVVLDPAKLTHLNLLLDT
jgi:RNA polymerase sigma-70 factor, ECF subfamily